MDSIILKTMPFLVVIMFIRVSSNTF